MKCVGVDVCFSFCVNGHTAYSPSQALSWEGAGFFESQHQYFSSSSSKVPRGNNLPLILNILDPTINLSKSPKNHVVPFEISLNQKEIVFMQWETTILHWNKYKLGQIWLQVLQTDKFISSEVDNTGWHLISIVWSGKFTLYIKILVLLVTFSLDVFIWSLFPAVYPVFTHLMVWVPSFTEQHFKT